MNAAGADAPNWQIEHEVSYYRGKTVISTTAKTEVLDPKTGKMEMRTGTLTRTYDPTTKTFEMNSAFLDELPSWVGHAGPSLRNGKTPTVSYLTMQQMNQMGIEYGELQTVKMSSIQNIRAIAEYNRMIEHENLSPEEAVMKSHSVVYASTSIVQSGHRIVSVRVVGGRRSKFQDMLGHYDRDFGREVEPVPDLVEKHDGIIEEYGQGLVGRDTEVLWDYDVYLEVAPFGGAP